MNKERRIACNGISGHVFFISFTVNGKISLTPAGGGSGFLRRKQKWLKKDKNWNK